MTSALEIRGMTHRYSGGQRPTLFGVDLMVRAGQMVALLGPSGSGKTTMLRAAAGLERPSAGTVSLDGRDVTQIPAEQRGMTMMFQKPLLFPHLDVQDNVAFPLRVAGMSRREARARASAHLELVGLAGYGRRRPRQLSGGQEQRVALARALAAEPAVLLLDEPFSALDPMLRASMHDLLAQVRNGMAPTILMVTHDLDEAGLADTVAVLVDGTLRQHGELDELYRAPADLAVARLLGGFSEVPAIVDHDGVWSVFGHLRPEPMPSLAPGEAATMLVRQEHVSLAPSDVDSPHAGRVVAVRRSGVRHVASVRLEVPSWGPPVEVAVELPPAVIARIGDRVTLALSGPVAAVASRGGGDDLDRAGQRAMDGALVGDRQ